MTHNTISIERASNGRYSLGDDNFHIHSDSIRVQLEGEEINSFDFSNELERFYTLGDRQGKVYSDTSDTSGVQIKREIFVSDDGKCSAVRFAVKNQRDCRIYFNGINILEIHEVLTA